jgi:hypothetical protein
MATTHYTIIDPSVDPNDDAGDVPNDVPNDDCIDDTTDDCTADLTDIPKRDPTVDNVPTDSSSYDDPTDESPIESRRCQNASIFLSG